jgi:hypothetical protein
MGTEQELSTSYSHEENAIVERANKEVMRHLRAMIFHDRVYSNWSTDQLPLVMRIMNSEEKVSTGVSPAELLFGNTVNLGRQLLYRTSEKGEVPTQKLSKYMSDMLLRQATLIEVARKTQLAQDTHHMSQFDAKFTEFPINSYVLLDHPSGPQHKFKMKRRGPFQVLNRVGSEYTLEDLISGKHISTHISNLTPFDYDENRTDPKEVAMHDQEEFVIDQILGHRGDKSRRTTLEFLVRWKDFPPEFDTWEPYSNLRDTEQLLTYLNANRMKTLIGTKHK